MSAEDADDMTLQLKAALDAIIARLAQEGESRDDALARLRRERPMDFDRVQRAIIKWRAHDARAAAEAAPLS